MTQKARVLLALASGKPLSIRTATSRMGIAHGSFGRIVHELRNTGLRIATGTNTKGARIYTLRTR